MYLAAEKNHRDIVDLLTSRGSIMDQEIQHGDFLFLSNYLCFNNYSNIASQ